MIINEDEVKALLYSDISAYRIEKETGVSRQAISQVKKGKASFDNLSFKTVKALQKFINTGGILDPENKR